MFQMLSFVSLLRWVTISEWFGSFLRRGLSVTNIPVCILTQLSNVDLIYCLKYTLFVYFSIQCLCTLQSYMDDFLHFQLWPHMTFHVRINAGSMLLADIIAHVIFKVLGKCTVNNNNDLLSLNMLNYKVGPVFFCCCYI